MAADVIANNKILGIFPEGTRSKSQEPPYLSEGKTGVARLAASFPDMPILPVAHWGTREMMIPKNTNGLDFGGKPESPTENQ